MKRRQKRLHGKAARYPYQERVGEVLATARRRNKCWTQVEAAAELGISQPELSRFERGRCAMSLEMFALACRVYGVKPSEVLAEIEGDDA